MQILPLASIVAAAAAAASPAPQLASGATSPPVLVERVFDGDTIAVSTVGRVRLLGIDAPEIGRGYDTPAPFGREAREKLESLVLHRWVRLEEDGDATDAYARRLAYVIREDGVFVNAAIVREGLARVTARVPLRRLQELKRAETEAQAFRRGMWGAAPSIASAEYTRRSGAKRSPASKRNTSKTRKKKKPQ